MDKRMPDFRDCIDFERFTGSDYCQSKNLLTYTTNHSNSIILKNLTSGEKKYISIPDENTSNPSFSEDGSCMLFLSVSAVKEYRICIYDMESGEIRKLAILTNPIKEPMWSPDGQYILFASSQITSTAEKRRKDEPLVIEDFGYKFDGVGYFPPDSHTHLFLLTVETGEIAQLTDGLSDELHHNWSPDSKWITYAGNENRPKQESIGYDLYVLNLAGEKRMISHGLWMVSYPNPIRPVFTADSIGVIMGALNPEADTSLGYPDIVFFRFSVDGGAPELIFESSEECYQCVQFPYNAGCGRGMDKVQITPNGDWVYFVSGWQGQGNIYKVAVQSDDHHAKLVIGGKQVFNGLGTIRNGKMMVSKSETDMPEAYYLLDTETDTLTEKIAQSAQEIYETVKLTSAEDFVFETLDGESSVQGWVQPPLKKEDGKRYPTILYIHGGPHPFYTYGLTMEFQCLAAEGFGILYCNPRGSSGYGSTHQNMVRAMDGSAYLDLLQFVEEATRRYDWIDPDRLGVTGGSYGGYMTNYIATHAKKFKAYVTQRSVSNDLISFASTDMQGSSKGYDNFEEFMVHLLEKSPVSYAERIDKPFLILHGIDDYRTPVEGAHQLFVAIKDIHPELPVKMVLFPNTNHDQPQNPNLLDLYYKELVSWFKKYL